ncbi:hypothetical protein WOLCODRAFT_135407 [Wolfiporia cocos MD-104 SS10]|uniref:Exocyst complex component Sec3 PIP2-binding N-terminal domain-containing protein n=1 Tax=Wolfiporia cocos (strain MD-104) TaxID=742152 RepID=A0A2H3J8G6_WOLCO|nr:hypothetical protein WOLCODRAFT_135407 [Wolfiporia cocos MD-104 SS10]
MDALDYEATRRAIVSSVFSKLNATGHAESYVAHIKIREEGAQDESAKKERYILLSQGNSGGGFIHKSKRNPNGSFSIGKTWQVTELRGVEVISPTTFNITMARTYRWTSVSSKDQISFIAALVKLFRTVTNGSAPLQLRGVQIPDAPSTSRPPQLELGRMERAPTPTNGTPLPPASPRRPTNEFEKQQRSGQLFDDVSIPAPQPRSAQQPRRPQTPTRTETPASGSRSALPPGTQDRSGAARPSTPSSQPAIPSILRPGHAVRLSNATSSIRTSANSTSSGAASLLSPTSPTSVRSGLQAPVISTSPPIRSAMQASPVPIPSVTRANGSGSLLSLDAVSSSPSTQPSPLSTYHSTPDSHSPALPAVSESLAPPRKIPSRAPSMGPNGPSELRRDQNARISFFDPANQATLNRLLSGDVVIHDDAEGEGEMGTFEDESAQATLDNMEEMLEGYEWASDDIFSRRSVTGAADRIEARLLDELMALDKANIHSFIESDDRVNLVLKYLDDAIAELDGMDSVLSSYKIHLNAVNDDIAYVQSQNRGLQVQIQNQRSLMDELEELLQTVHVDKEAMVALTQESLEKDSGIQRLEEAATELYKALQAGRDRDMAATMERLDEYRSHNSHFCKRLLDYLSIMVSAQSKMTLGDNDGIVKSSKGRPSLKDHSKMEDYLSRYSGLILYVKEMDEGIYAKLCAAYFSAASSLYLQQVKALLTICSNHVKKPTEEDPDGFGMLSPTTGTKASSGMRRAGTIVRSPLEARREKKERSDGDMNASDALSLVLDQIAQAIYREEAFVTAFLQVDNSGITFADYVGLENYFRRQAARAAGLSPATAKLVRGAMELIFGFLANELKAWLDGALSKDKLQIVGLIAALERFLGDAEERGNAFLLNLLDKQHSRSKQLFERRVSEHIKSVEDTRLTSKKRNGVAPFIKGFPAYVGRVESQLIGADTLEIRHTVDQAYDKIVQSMFDALKHMAKMDGEGEDKGQLNYHVILIENMHYFVAEISQLQIGSVAVFLKRAEAIYEENLNAYVKIVLRRPFYKIIDYFEGVERLLKTTAPTEVSSNSSYSRSTLKKVVKEYNGKDVRKHIDALFKRVEKHFEEAEEKTTTDDSIGIASGTVMVGVWKACEEELLRITELFAKRINQCYKETGVLLEYSAADVEAAFKRHRVNG